MTSTSDVDNNFKKAIYLLHSDDPQSATELRLMLDELIKQRYGPSKMLVHHLTPQHLELEKNFPGVATEKSETEPDPESMAVDADASGEVINLTNSPVKTISDSPDTIADSDDVPMLSVPTNEEVENLKEFGDLNCCVCGEMMFTATNRLIECSQCGSLYHQECHKPTITNEETCDEKERTWQCNNCNDKPSTSRAAAAAAAASGVALAMEPIPLITKTKSSASSSHSSSSNSSSPFYKQDRSSSSSRKHHKSSSSSKSQKEERGGGSGSSSKTTSVITPSINIISAPDKSGTASSSSKSKSSSSHSSSSKSSSSKSSSKHHDSSKKKSGKERQKERTGVKISASMLKIVNVSSSEKN